MLLTIFSSFSCPTLTVHTELSPTELSPQGVVPSTAPAPTTFNLQEIHRLLPHRYPFALVDRIVDFIPGDRAVGLKNVTFNEQFFQGHFPDYPLMPGVLIVEAMAQVGGIVLTHLPEYTSLPEQVRALFVFTGIDKVRFRRQVVPGDQLIMTVELLSFKRGRFATMKARAEVEGQVACDGELMFSMVEV